MATQSHNFKVIVLGTSEIGKTCLIKRFCTRTYEPSKCKVTMGFDFTSNKIERNNKQINLEIWDTAGQEQYHAIAKMYYKDVHGVILVYDITRRKSFEKLNFWIEDLAAHGNKLEERILVGTKTDLEDEREVDLLEAKRFAAENKLSWMECSSKTGIGVDNIFNTLADKMINSYNTNHNFRDLFNRKTLVVMRPDKDVNTGNNYRLSKKSINKSRKDGCCS